MTLDRAEPGTRPAPHPTPAAESDPATGPATAPSTGPTGPPTAPPPAPADVLGAGVIAWRTARNGELEVLLVHRPADDAWSWPSGRPERGEGLAECAAREAVETTGRQVVLGRPLPASRSGPGPAGAGHEVREVSYWAARLNGRPDDRPREHPREVDDVRWVTPEAAAARLTHPSDAVPLAALVGHAAAGTLATTATLVVRHATARPRDAWARADADRPLVASGKRQAMALGALLQCWRPEHVVSSPWRRCLETMDPYVAASGARLRTKGGLSEAGHRRSPAKAGRHVRGLMESAHGGVLCTHRPVLGDVLDAVRAWCAPEVVGLVPAANPYLHPGDVLVAHVAHVSNGTPRHATHPVVVAVERHGTR